ncbi:MAG: cupin domain-containing protein [Candidatus Heimdallarchaeaceae archaeon]
MDEQSVSKKWGYEIWFANNEQYCGKLLCINQNRWSSEGAFHYHKIKDETFFVIEGCLDLDYYEDDVFYSISLHPLQSFRVHPYVKHRFSTKSHQCKFIEASTTHKDSDSYRCQWNEVEKEWIDSNV